MVVINTRVKQCTNTQTWPGMRAALTAFVMNVARLNNPPNDVGNIIILLGDSSVILGDTKRYPG